jgi:hypothetical protein
MIQLKIILNNISTPKLDDEDREVQEFKAELANLFFLIIVIRLVNFAYIKSKKNFIIF